ncbi:MULTISPECIES: WD40 repeat domain-containing protein [Kamptonema]|uniref:WD40 repeat domain-containing protein n=1 Tax=Kamptonema TaxID=1501433 RepID=UPI0001DAC808|nr:MULTISPECIES: hypothetical protein [Kamptonema]CBN55513.1 exported hypothetical protein [Kamptonema sp. PCC 6506]
MLKPVALCLIVLSLIGTSALADNGVGEWYLQRGNTNTVGRYQISGDRKGQVSIKDITTGEVIRTFQMDAGLVVRETFILNAGKTVAASQKDHTVFWDLATGRTIARVAQPVYGFSHDEKKFFTYDREGIFLYAFPSFKRICPLQEGNTPGGPVAFQFSPNNRLLVINLMTNLPAEENSYPYPNYAYRYRSFTRLFNVETCQEIPEFRELNFTHLFGRFSPDSRFYEIKESWPRWDRNLPVGAWRVNLTTFELEQIPDFPIDPDLGI